MGFAQTKWVFCQIGARERYAVPRALHHYDVLELLVTDIWVRPKNVLGWLKPGLRARFHADLAATDVHALNYHSIAFEARARLNSLRGWPLTMARNEWFQREVVLKLTQARSDAPRTLVAYSYAAAEIFKLARARGWRTVLGQIDPGPFEERIVAKLYDAHPNQRGFWQPAPSQYWASWRDECALADRIVVNSPWSQAALLEEGIPAAKIKVVPLAFDGPKAVKSFRREYPAKFTLSRPLRVLFLGQINLRKGVGPLFDAIRLLREEPISFTFVGPIQISIPQDLERNSRVKWMHSVTHQNTAEFYRSADVFIFPTFSDGFGLTQLEAQAWKLPVIATRFCGEVVEHGKNGWLLSDVNADLIAGVLRDFCRSPASLQKLSEYARLVERFDLAHVGKQWLRIFD